MTKAHKCVAHSSNDKGTGFRQYNQATLSDQERAHIPVTRSALRGDTARPLGISAEMKTDRSWYWMVATVSANTDKAVLLSTPTTEQWVPYKMIKAITDVMAVGETQRLAIPIGTAKEKGFIV